MVLDNHHLFHNAEWLKQLAENNIFVFFGPSGSTGVCHVQKKTKITIYSDEKKSHIISLNKKNR